ncbi:hypothetical protein FRC05_008940 [Tulasnella sp. 425]|nr:hypothetical protein FRC05_008940 [Tulasnella sp. 425]
MESGWREIYELEQAASSIHNELLRRAALLRRHWNYSTRRIYQLPQEVFTEILILDIVSSGSEERKGFGSFHRKQPSRRTQLCHVSHLFLQTILGTPRLWADIQWDRDDFTRCLKMSEQAPLSIRCLESNHTRLSGSVAMEEFLRAIWQHSRRWETLSLKLRYSISQLQFLEFEAPQLRNLNLDVMGPLTESSVIKISGYPSLRNLSLHMTGLSQWNDLDLSHLRSLSLSWILREGGPSVEKLIETLKVAPSLRRLSLYRVTIVSSNKEQHLEPQIVHLPALLALRLDELPTGLADYLITNIRTPHLKSFCVRGLHLKRVDNPTSDQNPYHHFFQVLIPKLTAATTGLTISNEVSSRAVYSHADNSSAERSSDAIEGSADFGFRAEDSLEAVRQMVQFITSIGIAVPITILANGRGPHLDVIYSTIPSFPVDVLGKLPTVTKISAFSLADALNILGFLGSLRRDEETGQLRWACPQLQLLQFTEVRDLTLEHCQAFLDARYGDGNPLLVEGEIVQRPPRVTIDHAFFSEDE